MKPIIAATGQTIMPIGDLDIALAAEQKVARAKARRKQREAFDATELHRGAKVELPDGTMGTFLEFGRTEAGACGC